MKEEKIKEYFERVPASLQELFEGASFLWDPLDRLDDFFARHLTGAEVRIGEGTVVEPGAVIKGPALIGKNCEIRAGAYIRGYLITGDNCVIGHGTEIIRSIVMDHVQLSHFNYVGDSILGYGVHLGAGAKIANSRFDERNVQVGEVDTGRAKLGVVLGDNCQLGVNTALGPGVIFAKNTWWAGRDILKSGFYDKAAIKGLL